MSTPKLKPVPLKERDPKGLNPNQPGAKLDAGKVRPSLILRDMPLAMLALAEVATYGAEKYTDGGWQYVEDGFVRYTDALERHLIKEGCENIDEESGLLHAAQVAWNAMARLELMLRERESNKI